MPKLGGFRRVIGKQAVRPTLSAFCPAIPSASRVRGSWLLGTEVEATALVVAGDSDHQLCFDAAPFQLNGDDENKQPVADSLVPVSVKVHDHFWSSPNSFATACGTIGER